MGARPVVIQHRSSSKQDRLAVVEVGLVGSLILVSQMGVSWFVPGYDGEGHGVVVTKIDFLWV